MPSTFPSYKTKNVLILGLGLLGRGIKDATFFAEQGANVTVTDLKTTEQLKDSIEQLKNYKINFTLGGHKDEDILKADLIIRGAAVPMTSPFVKLALKHKIPVEMDESFFARYCPCPIIGITGTRGKSTTTVLISEILKQNWQNDKRKVYASGNLQGEATLPLLNKVTKDDLVVLELSSWQLQGWGQNKISPHVAVFTNIYPDHLNYYKSMVHYINDKKNIFKYQKAEDYCVINSEQAETKKMATAIKSKKILFAPSNIPSGWKLRIIGSHNLENAAAAMAVGKIFGLTDEQMQKTICEFPGLEHRLEFVRDINGITFINDTTSTTPIAGVHALKAVTPPIVLIAGGASKNLKLTPFAKNICEKVKAVILLEGTATNDLANEIEKQNCQHLIVGRFNNFEEAIRRAFSISLPGDTILLSPGCASFGMFINEFDRGNQFKKIINKL